MSKILCLNGSAQDPSLNERYLRLAADAAKAAGAEIDFINIRELNLPLFRGYDEIPAEVPDLLKRVQDADGYLLASPEYHHSMTATLKGFFEYFEGSEMKGKPLGLLGASTSQFGTVQAQHSLYATIRTFGAWLIPMEVFVPRADKLYPEGGEVPKDDGTIERVQKLGQIVVKAAEALPAIQ